MFIAKINASLGGTRVVSLSLLSLLLATSIRLGIVAEFVSDFVSVLEKHGSIVTLLGVRNLL